MSERGCTCGPNGSPDECAAELAAGGWCPRPRNQATKKRIKCPVCEWPIPKVVGVICDRCGSEFK